MIFSKDRFATSAYPLACGWKGGWGVVILDSQLLAELFEGCVVKLASIVWDKHPKDSKMVDNVLLDEASDILLGDLC